MLVPWLIYPAVGGDLAGAFAAQALWDAIWPMLVGAALAAGLWALGDPLPRVPAGDILVVEEAAFRAGAPLGVMFERLDLGLQTMAGGGPVAPDDRARPRRGGVREPLRPPTARGRASAPARK